MTERVPIDRPDVEQLYDELLARAWGMYDVVKGERPDAVTVQRRLAHAAQGMVHAVRHGGPPGAADADALMLLLWPSGEPEPDHLWWKTPLGALLRVRSAAVGHLRPCPPASGGDQSSSDYDDRLAAVG